VAVLSQNQGERKKLTTFYQNAKKSKSNHIEKCEQIISGMQKKEFRHPPVAFYTRELLPRIEKAFTPTIHRMSPDKSKLLGVIREFVDRYHENLQEYAINTKKKLVSSLLTQLEKRQNQQTSELMSLLITSLNKEVDNLQKDEFTAHTIMLPDGLLRAFQRNQLETLKTAVRKLLEDSFKSVLKDLKNYYPILVPQDGDETETQKKGKKQLHIPTVVKREEIQKKLIKYENNLRDLYKNYMFDKIVDNNEPNKLTGISKMPPIIRHRADFNDKLAEKVVQFTGVIPDYFTVVQGGQGSKNIIVSFDIDNQQIIFQNPLDQELLTKLKACGTLEGSNTGALYPIFVPTKLRGQKDENKQIVPVTPQLYSSDLDDDFPGSIVVPVIDKSEESQYKEFISKRHKNITFVVIINDSLEEDEENRLKINVGRKRHIIKLLAEYVLKLSRYWVLDDDIKNFYEVAEALYHAPCSIGRALYYAQLVFKQEIQEESFMQRASDLIWELFKCSDTTSDAAKLLSKYTVLKDLPPEVSAQTYAVKQEFSLFEQLCKKAGIHSKLEEIMKEKLCRVAQVALYNRNTNFQAIRNLQIIKGDYSHINREQIYQVVLFNSKATQGIEYMNREDFFRTGISSALNTFL